MANPKTDKQWEAAVMRAVHRRQNNVEGKPKKIEILADKLVDFAIEGQGWAMSEIGNRLDGRAHQSTSTTVEAGDALSVLLTEIGQQRITTLDEQGDA